MASPAASRAASTGSGDTERIDLLASFAPLARPPLDRPRSSEPLHEQRPLSRGRSKAQQWCAATHRCWPRASGSPFPSPRDQLDQLKDAMQVSARASSASGVRCSTGLVGDRFLAVQAEDQGAALAEYGRARGRLMALCAAIRSVAAAPLAPF
jgi:hypothetical protein